MVLPLIRTYPGHADYDLAVRYLDRFVCDPVLKRGVPRSRTSVAVDRGGEPLSYPGGFAKAYVVDCGPKVYALRVWLHDIGNAARHYDAVTSLLKQHRVLYFADTEFMGKGILIKGHAYPILRMEWIEGYGCREFIKQNLGNSNLLRAAADAFLALVRELHSNGIGHGDLQADNILLRQNNGVIHYKLIDYDTLVIPALIGEAVSSAGHPAYQHPRRSESMSSTARDDYFSELVIYLCLRAVAEDPTLWGEFPARGRDKELLFVAADFAAETPSAVFRRLYALGGDVQKLVVVLWNFARCPGIHLLQPLEAVLSLITNSSVPSVRPMQSQLLRTPFETFVDQKLKEANARRDQPAGWLDDLAFRSVFSVTSTPLRSSTGKLLTPTPIKPDSTMRERDTLGRFTASTATSKSANSFEEVLAKMQAISRVDHSPPSPPPQRKIDWDTFFWIGFAILLAIFLIHSCQS